MHTITTAAHTAHLDPMTGEGLLILPDAARDVLDPMGGMVSLHAADWADMVARLDRLGWEPSEGKDGYWEHVGMTREGREVVNLYGRDPISSSADLDDCVGAQIELLTLAGIVLG